MSILVGALSENNIGNNLPLINYQIPDNLISGVPVGTIIPYYAATNINLPEGWELCDGHTINNSNHDYDNLITLGLSYSANLIYLPNLSQKCLIGNNSNTVLNTYIDDSIHDNFLHNHQINNTHTLTHYHTNLSHSHILYVSSVLEDDSKLLHKHTLRKHYHYLYSHTHYTPTHGHYVTATAFTHGHSHNWYVPMQIDQYSSGQASVTKDSISGYNQSSNPYLKPEFNYGLDCSVPKETLTAVKNNGSDTHKIVATNSLTLSEAIGAKSTNNNNTEYTDASEACTDVITSDSSETINNINDNYNDIITNTSNVTNHYDNIPRINLYYIIKCK